MKTLVCSVNSFHESSRYFPVAANEPEVLPIGLLLRLRIRCIGKTNKHLSEVFAMA